MHDLDAFQHTFRDVWRRVHTDVLSDDAFSFVNSVSLYSILSLLLMPAMYPMSDDIRTSYQLYLPTSVWSDLPRAPDTKFEVLTVHFDHLMEFYLDEPTGVMLTWVRIIHYAALLRELERHDMMPTTAWLELMNVAMATFMTPYTQEMYVHHVHRIGTWIREYMMSEYEIPTDLSLWIGFDGLLVSEDAVTIDDAPVNNDVTIDDDPLDNPTPAPTMGHAEAMNYVNSLEQVDMADSATYKCPFCWGLYNDSDADPEDTNDLTVCKTPCNHMFHKGCLVQILEGFSTLCSVFFRELNLH